MAKKEPPQEYIEVLEVLNVLYDEVDGCSFYDYIFPDNQKQGEQCSHYENYTTTRENWELRPHVHQGASRPYYTTTRENQELRP